MITKVINGNVFDTPYNHIAFAINTKGYNDAGFAGQVSERVPKIANTGKKDLGEVVSIESKGKIFHGLVCHSLEDNGWGGAPKAIITCLEKIQVTDTEPIAVVLMGAGMIGQMSGADVKANIRAIHQSKKNCVVYSLQYSEKAIFDVLK